MYDDQGVKISLHLRDALIGDALLARALKGKGHRHDADRQYAHVLGNFCDDGRRARARAAAHARRDEYEVGALQNFLDFRLVALRRCFPEIRHAARAEPLRQLSSDGERLDARLFHIGKLLRIRIDRDQLHIKLVPLGYTLDDAVAAAAHADDLYRDYRSLDLRIIRYHGSGSPSLCLADPSLLSIIHLLLFAVLLAIPAKRGKMLNSSRSPPLFEDVSSPKLPQAAREACPRASRRSLKARQRSSTRRGGLRPKARRTRTQGS